MRITTRQITQPLDVELRDLTKNPVTSAEHAELRGYGVPAEWHDGYALTASAAKISLKELVRRRKRELDAHHAANGGGTAERSTPARVKRIFGATR